MANNQITPFQLTDQFTMDNFNQRINETNTALQNKAPAGYGLGSISKFISSSDDLNDVVYDGWYYFDAPPINAPLLDGVNAVGYSSMLVSNRDPSLYVTQEIFCYASWEAFNCVLRRCRINGEWKPWEWVNPPMMLNTEYRTTERYLGKPVYVKLLDCGLLVKGTLTYPHGISDIDVCVRYSGVASTSTGVFSGKGALPSFTTPSALNSEWNIFVQNFGTTNIDIYNGGGLTGCPVYVTVWYTKTTD